MTSEAVKRKLSAILSADVKEYSRLMSQDERGTIRTLSAYKEAMSMLIQEYKGRVVDSPGDNLLAEFGSVVDAVNCAVEVQRELAERNADLPPARQMEFRIGINLGDVVEKEGSLYGDGVNIAARVEGLADGGGICISGTVYDQVKNKLGLEYEYLGEQTVKNIPEPVRVYRVLSFPGAAAHRVVKAKSAVGRTWRNVVMAIAAIFFVGAAVAVWHFHFRPPALEVASVQKMAFSLPDKPSIAVLPFDNLSDDPNQEYFVDGMTDDLITDLSKISGLFVIARNSTFTYKGKPVRIRQVAEELGVRYVLEGSVRKADAKVRINAQLIDATTGNHLWAERYDGKLDDVFKLQDKITQKIIKALALKLTASEKEQTVRDYTDNLEAYDYYLRGKQLLNKMSQEGTDRAKSMFKKAIDFDPEFALAYTEHARANVIRSIMYYGGGESLKEAHEFVSRALVLDSSLPDAYAVLAELQLRKRLHDEAIASAAKAVALDPNKADTYLIQARVLMYAGRHNDALTAVNMAFRLNPKAPPSYEYALGMVQFNHRQYAQAIVSLKKAEKGMPDFVGTWSGLVQSYAYLGRLDEAKAELRKFLGAYPWYNLTSCRIFSLYKLEEDTEHRVEGFRIAGLPRVAYGHKQKLDSSSE
jgi:TolB-like protein/class 3 adenylate cyclase